MGVASLSTVGDITKKTYTMRGTFGFTGGDYGITTGAELLNTLYSKQVGFVGGV